MPNRNLHFTVGAMPVEVARQGAIEYQRANGLHVVANPQHAVVDNSVIPQVAEAYRRMPSFDANALPAFHAMRREVAKQFDYLTRPRTRGGMGFDVSVENEDPYDVTKPGGTREFFDDVAKRRMRVLSAASTGSHPVFSDDENEMFRAVHDVFGHAGTGRGIDMHGEEAAYRKHAQMFSPLARQALATETRGQNHTMLDQKGEFPEQKVAILPLQMRQFSFVDPKNAAGQMNAVHDANLEQRKQGLVNTFRTRRGISAG